MLIVQYVSWDVADPGLNLREIVKISTQYLVALCWRGDQRFEFLSTTHRSCDTCDRITLWNSTWEMINDWDFLVPICTSDQYYPQKLWHNNTMKQYLHQSWSYMQTLRSDMFALYFTCFVTICSETSHLIVIFAFERVDRLNKQWFSIWHDEFVYVLELMCHRIKSEKINVEKM